jgi:hypothetical protein
MSFAPPGVGAPQCGTGCKLDRNSISFFQLLDLLLSFDCLDGNCNFF